jgi:hypothetical protein
MTYEQQARALLGVPFRPQGRDPGTGVDCIGLIIEAFAIPTTGVRRDYRLRGDHRSEIEAGLLGLFRWVARTQCRPGDVMLLSVAPEQWHLAIRSSAGFIHADAKIGRVVETPGRPPWKLVRVFRKRSRRRKGRVS